MRRVEEGRVQQRLQLGGTLQVGPLPRLLRELTAADSYRLTVLSKQNGHIASSTLLVEPHDASDLQ